MEMRRIEDPCLTKIRTHCTRGGSSSKTLHTVGEILRYWLEVLNGVLDPKMPTIVAAPCGALRFVPRCPGSHA
jgi:hypothetical protein